MKREKGSLAKKRARDKSLQRSRALLTIVAVLATLVVIYIGMGIFFQSHFCFGTSIDGIPAGGKSVAQMEELITQEVDGYVLRLHERNDGEEEISGKSIAIQPVFNGELEQLLEDQNGFAWGKTLFTHSDLELKTAISYDETALKEAIANLSCMQKENQEAPVDAAVSEYSDGYTMVPAKQGTTIRTDVLLGCIEDAVATLSGEINLEDADCYEKPEIEDDNEKLASLIEEMNRYTSTKITYDFDVADEVLDGSTISEWLIVDDDLNLTVDEDGVLAFVKGLASKYNTCYKPKTLKTSYGQTVTITNGPYGWKIDLAGEKEKLLEELKEGKQEKREPIYAQTANSHGENDYGDSYVEINLTAQHLFLYKDGKLITESDLVSGNVAKNHTTPGGAFLLTYKTKNAILRGPDYETPVNFWMPFNGGIGMHDLTSRKAFGGDIYKKNGSHGCINLPYSAAQKIYETIDKGYCVLVYYLPGTESTAVKQKEAAEVINAISIIGPVTLESETAIVNARTLYNALTDEIKANVTNYQTLVDAENTLAALKSGAAPAPAEQPVDGAAGN